MVAVLVDCALYENGKRLDLPSSLEALDALDDHPAAFAWVGLQMPQHEELREVAERLGIAEHIDVESVLAPHRRPVMSADGPVLEVVLRTAKYVDSAEVISLGELTLLVTDRAIVSLRFGQASPLATLRATLEREPERLAAGSYGVLGEILVKAIADFSPALDGFEHDLTEVEQDVFSESGPQPVRRLFHLKREVRQFQAPLEALDEPLARLTRFMTRTCRVSGVPTDILDDLATAQHQLNRTVSRTRSLSNLLDAALTASLAQTGVKQNEDMRKISAWVAIGGLNTLIAGVYGMNFEHMPELEWTLGYPLVLGFMAVVSAVLHRYFQKSGWL
jgi:magnesium transporter